MKKPTIDDAMKMAHKYGEKGVGSGGAFGDPAVVELARAYVALLQAVEMQTEAIKSAQHTLSRTIDRLGEWPKDR
jgi:hypothetical protein